MRRQWLGSEFIVYDFDIAVRTDYNAVRTECGVALREVDALLFIDGSLGREPSTYMTARSGKSVADYVVIGTVVFVSQTIAHSGARHNGIDVIDSDNVGHYRVEMSAAFGSDSTSVIKKTELHGFVLGDNLIVCHYFTET